MESMSQEECLTVKHRDRAEEEEGQTGGNTERRKSSASAGTKRLKLKCPEPPPCLIGIGN